jgi:hypothetical protein
MNGSEMLEKLHSRCTNTIEFKPEWANTTGYLNGAVYEPLEGDDGTAYACMDNHHRKIILVKTCFGNVVVFQRYSHGELGGVTGNFPTELRPWLPSGAWSADSLELNVSPYLDAGCNIGVKLKQLRNNFDRVGYKLLRTINGTPMRKVMVLLGNANDTNGITVVEGIIVREDANGRSFAIALPDGVCMATNIVEKVKESDEYYYSTSMLPIGSTNLQYLSLVEAQYKVRFNDDLITAMRSAKTLKTNIRSKTEAIQYISERYEFFNDTGGYLNLSKPSESFKVNEDHFTPQVIITKLGS